MPTVDPPSADVPITVTPILSASRQFNNLPVHRLDEAATVAFTINTSALSPPITRIDPLISVPVVNAFYAYLFDDPRMIRNILGTDAGQIGSPTWGPSDDEDIQTLQSIAFPLYFCRYQTVPQGYTKRGKTYYIHVAHESYLIGGITQPTTRILYAAMFHVNRGIPRKNPNA